MNRTSYRVWWLVLLSLIENYRSEARIFDLTKQIKRAMLRIKFERSPANYKFVCTHLKIAFIG